MRTRSFPPAGAGLAALIALSIVIVTANPVRLHADPALDASAWEAEVAPAAPEAPIAVEPQRRLRELKSGLTADDPLAVLEAVRYALDEVGDGATYVWHREQGPLWGMVRPVRSFRNADGRICRHIIVTLSLDEYTSQTDGDACRLEDNRWTLANELALPAADASAAP